MPDHRSRIVAWTKPFEEGSGEQAHERLLAR